MRMIVNISDPVLSTQVYSVPEARSPVAKNDRVFLFKELNHVKGIRMGSCHCYIFHYRSSNEQRSGQDSEKEVSMKFLMIVLTVHFVAEMIGNKRNAAKKGKTDERNEKVLHPAEFDIR
jgi:hypothetical protein